MHSRIQHPWADYFSATKHSQLATGGIWNCEQLYGYDKFNRVYDFTV